MKENWTRNLMVYMITELPSITSTVITHYFQKFTILIEKYSVFLNLHTYTHIWIH